MKRMIIMAGFIIMLLAMPITTVHANAEVGIKQSSIITRADVIETKYRVNNGVLQCRRWNKTHGYWVDSAWINLT